MDRFELLELMQQAPAIRGLPLADLSRLAEAGQRREFAAGERLLVQGEPADDIYLLLEGGVSIRGSAEGQGEHEIATRNALDWLGETAVFDAGPRSATVIAESDCVAFAIPRQAFLEVVTPNVDAVLELLRTLIARLRESDAQLIGSMGEQLRALQSMNRRLSRENRQLISAFDEQHGFETFVGTSPAAQAVRAAARQAGESALPVLLAGETGTGKEILARAIHAASERSKRPFVALNCAHFPEALLESELFGHARGAFTGATDLKPGLVESADGGTLFLDEVADMPLALQAALLRFLEFGEFRRLGETEVRHARVGVIAATHRDLDEQVRSGAFRSDLLYRLDVIRVSIPPLRERLEDLPQLVSYCSERTAQRLGVPPLRISAEALDALARYDFPGNVRELENEIERLYVVLKQEELVTPDAFSAKVAAGRAASGSGYAEAVREFKTQLIQKALREAGGNRARAAQRLGLHRSNLLRTIKSLSLDD